MKWNEIPLYTSWGNTQQTIDWHDLEHQMEKFRREYHLDMDPDFQRGHVWGREKQIAYVEYVLRGGVQSRDIIFNCHDWPEGYGPIQIVDGKQRLEAVLLFVRNELPVLGGFYRKDMGGGRIPRRYELIFHINTLQTRREVLQLYLEINSGGVVHTEEEIERVRRLLLMENVGEQQKENKNDRLL